jgi:hypothetical protein
MRKLPAMHDAMQQQVEVRVLQVDISSAPGHTVRAQWRRATVGCSQSKQGFRGLLTWAMATSSIMANTRAVLRMVAIVVVDDSSLSVGEQRMAHIVSTGVQ